MCCDRPRPRSRSGRCRLLRPQGLRAGQGRHRSYLADVDDPVRLQPARALRPGVHGRRRHSSAPRHDHSAKLGSVERFIGVLTEHYAGAFPAWLSPVQVRLIPVAEAFDDYVKDVAAKLRERGVRVETDLSDDRFGKKIRNASKDKIPFTLIVGGEDVEAGAVSFRLRDGSQHNGVAVDRAVELIVSHIEQRNNADQIDDLDEA